MTDPHFTTDAYLAMGTDGLSRLASLLSVKPDYLFVDTQPQNTSRFDNKENFIIATTIEGDFRYIAEIFIWNAQEQDILRVFETASTHDISIVVEDTSEGASPLDEILFCHGDRFAAEIGEDDTFGEIYLANPTAMRKTLARQSGRAQSGP